MTIAPALLARPYFSRHDALSSGACDAELRTACQDGVITRIRRGFYTGRPVPWPVDRYRVDALIEQALHPQQRPSHHTALAVARLPLHEPDLSVLHMRWRSAGRRQRSGRTHVHEALFPDSGCRVARAVMETALLDPESALMAADEALRNRRTTVDDLGLWARRLAFSRGGAGVVLVHRLADGRRESPGESRSALALHHLGYATTPQVTVVGRQGDYRVDEALDGEWVCFEYDGRDKYADPLSRRALPREKLREDDIRDQGWEVVRITNELLADPVLLRRTVEAARARARRRHGAAVRASDRTSLV
ncbi:hypothetical protein [Arsenicicoccus sp. oral taxon 190]|uniref:hypothetical protein n=1 Tax=Arsenicicoccus sp. oral taxon 190 TaxID=1658671 RepID=UPI0012E1897F|nr:hypothetical protein [Arsenicicoccus sp. oral taxon 190]